MVFLGIQFDTMNLTLSVPIQRVQETFTLLDQWLNANEMSRKEIQSVVGKLQFLANCVRPGRLFVSRILEFMRGLPDRGRFPVTDSVKADMRWWKLFLPRYNGISLMAVDHWSLPDEVFACDACLTGCGAWFHEKREYFHKTFPKFILDQNLIMNALEIRTVMVATKVWGKYWKGKRIVVQCDNEVSVLVLNTGRCRNAFLAACLKEVELMAAQYEFEIRANHIPGVVNRVPDALSRWDLDPAYREEFMIMVGELNPKEAFVYEGLFGFLDSW